MSRQNIQEHLFSFSCYFRLEVTEMDWLKVQDMMEEIQKYMDSVPKTVDDVKALLCSECQGTVAWYEGLVEFEAIGALVVETAARGHQACLEAVLSWEGTTIKDMINHGRKPRFQPGNRPLIRRDRFVH